MKPTVISGLLLLSLLPAAGMAETKSTRPIPADAPVSLMPIAVDGSEPRSAASLRESLRQPPVEIDSKPYRLSQQERQRMREQLRNQHYDSPKK